MKEITEQEAYLRLTTLCAQAEHCRQEMWDKMKHWELSEEIRQRVVERLEKERYIDDERYARAFVNDKLRYQKWGRRKIEQALWQKRIDDDIRQRVLDEVADEDYLDVLRPLLRQKRKMIKAGNSYELNQKLLRFALGRGFTFGLIRQCLDVEDIDDVEE